MANEITNYGRFYSALKSMRIPGDPEENKKLMVSQFTGGRTDSLREMTAAEYQSCCVTMEERAGSKERLRKKRSGTLVLMQKMGIDTTDWAKINDFCRQPRIMGKEFRHITEEEHLGLQRKLRAIMAKRSNSEPETCAETRKQKKGTEKYYLIDLGIQNPGLN